MRIRNYLFLFLILIFLVSCSTNHLYYDLLGQFPIENQGYGPEPKYAGLSEQPMTYGLVVSAECLHYKRSPSSEGKERIHRGVSWLIENVDLDGDGKPGWGLPQAWDAFSDGTTNPENHPYTITTAIVLDSLSCVETLEDFWTNEENAQIKRVLKDTIVYWVNDVWEEEDSYGYFWYSPNVADNYFSPNASSMMMGVIKQILEKNKLEIEKEQKSLIRGRIDKAASGIILQVMMQEDLPFWPYHGRPTSLNAKKQNDLVHHIYILWGIELYREYDGDINIPWSRDKALESIATFISKSEIYAFPQIQNEKNDPINSKPDRLWGVGMCLAFISRWGSNKQANEVLEVIVERYKFGPGPRYTLYPLDYKFDLIFYPRYSSHLLLGLAYYYFYP